MSDSTSRGVRIAVEGCGHGTLNAIYAAVERSCKERDWDGVDALIIGGDFQAVRNAADLNVMSVPAKYRELADFHEYYSGARKAPYLTIFVAGNHEASSHLWELFYGGWVASNIYYMGATNILRLGPLRIAGMSGIWKGFDFRKSHHERLPFNPDDIKSFYHVREIDVRKLLQVRSQVDIGISHDWPRAIEKHGNRRYLFNMKPDFERESNDGTLGNPAAKAVMDRLRPPYWFSAHLHCKFTAIKTYDPPTASTPKSNTDWVPSGPTTSTLPPPAASSSAANPDEIDLDMDENDAGLTEKKPSPPKPAEPAEPSESSDPTEALRAQLPAAFARPPTPSRPPASGQSVPPGITNTTVRFLALDKCLPGRKFLQLLEIPTQAAPPFTFQYDPEWLAITRAFAPFITIGERTPPPADQGETHYCNLIKAEETWVEEHIIRPGKLQIPHNFAVTAPPHVPGEPEWTEEQPDEYTNPQTVAFCELVGVPNMWDHPEGERIVRKELGPQPLASEDDGEGWTGRGRGRGRGGRGGRGRGRGRGRGGGRGGGGRGWGGRGRGGF